MTGPVIIGSERSEVGLPAGMEILRSGGSALDAVEAALRRCEDNLEDHYVGTGGLPNARGEVELDASIMIGSSRAFGAVAALKGYPNPISVARAVLEKLPQHALLVGEGAALFAQECGFTPAELLTEEARRLWRDALAPSADSVEGENTDAGAGDDAYRAAALALVQRLAPHEGPWGTINVLALDSSGELVVGVSDQRLSVQIPRPGRRFGHRRCGQLLRSALRRSGVHGSRGAQHARGRSARGGRCDWPWGTIRENACAAMLADAATLPDEFRAELRTLALTADGRHGGAAGQAGSVYALMTAGSTEPEFRARRVV